MNYAEMTDFEINKAVAIARGYAEENCDFGWTGKPDVGVEWNEQTGYPTKSFNYCNSWADAGPIIESKGISIVKFEGDHWIADGKAYWVDGVEWNIGGVGNKKPLRAAMIIFLMMQESK